MENRRHTSPQPRPEDIVTTLLDRLLDGIEPGIVSRHPLPQLRELRDRYQQVETGLSFGRRLVQGRLDIVLAEVGRRSAGSGGTSLVGDLPDVLAHGSRTSAPPRPLVETDMPDFVDVITEELGRVLNAGELARLSEVDDARLAEVAGELRSLERRVSAKRHEVHRIIDELQEEIVDRYRTGAASVDDLLA